MNIRYYTLLYIDIYLTMTLCYVTLRYIKQNKEQYYTDINIHVYCI